MKSENRICSSATKEGLTKLINEYYYSTSYVITERNEVVSEKTGRCVGTVKLQHTRFVSRYVFFAHPA